MSAQVAADLRAAADVLERDGWTQGQYHAVRDGKVCHCASGALAVATGAHVNVRSSKEKEYERENGDYPAVRRWDNACVALRDYVRRTIPDWNDAPDRTAAEVIAALRAAADAADAAEAQP